MDTLQAFIDGEYQYLMYDITVIVKDLKDQIRDNPDWYIESGTDEPWIDIRLCVDLNSHDGANWVFRTGDPSYDQRHSQFCSSGSIGLDTDPKDLLDELISQLE
jgi:hypothetical protein